MKKLIVAALVAVSAGWAQPVLRAIDPVVNGASYANAIAPGSIFVIFGTNLAGDQVVSAPSLPLQTTLGGVSIRFAPVAGGSSISALMIYTTRNQIAGLLPSSTAPGDYNVAVTNGAATSVPGRVRVVARSVGIVTADSSGAGQAQAQMFYTATTWALNRYTQGRLGQFDTNPAHTGEAFVLWATGLGADPASDLNGGSSGNQTAAGNVRIVLDGRELTPAYAGRASGLPGTDQINFTVPADARTGCSIPLHVIAGGGRSNTVMIAIARPGQTACEHPLFTADQLKKVSEGGTLVLGAFDLARLTESFVLDEPPPVDLITDTVGGNFSRYGVGNLHEYGDELLSPVGTCQVIRSRDDQPDPTPGGAPPTPLDAGAQLRLNGPNAANVAVPRDVLLYYMQLLYESDPFGGGGGTPVISAGTYSLAGSGGSQIGAFTAAVAVPAPLVWTNRDVIQEINRSAPLTLMWSGGGSDPVIILGSSSVQAGGTDEEPIFDTGLFICHANAAARSFSVPANILGQLPSSTGESGFGYLGLWLSGPANGGPFTAPLVGGGNIDRGSFTYSLGTGKEVSYR